MGRMYFKIQYYISPITDNAYAGGLTNAATMGQGTSWSRVKNFILLQLHDIFCLFYKISIIYIFEEFGGHLLFFLAFLEHSCKLHTIVSIIYSQVSIIRPGRSRLLEFEKKIVLVVFPNIQIRSLNRDQKLAVAALK